MKTTFNILTILFILVLFAFPAFAQDGSEAPAAVFVLPPMLLFLIGVNNRGTEAVKLWLSAPSLPANFSKDTQRVIVLASSFVIGVIAAVSIPDALSWLPETVQNSLFFGFPVAAVFLAAVASSFGGAVAQYVLMVLGGAGKWLSAPR